MLPRFELVLIALLPFPAAAAEVLRAEPAEVHVGEASARLRAESPPAPPRYTSSLGVVRGNLLDLADRRAPAFAIVAAQADVAGRIWRAATVITIVGKGQLPTQTRAGAKVFVEIDGQRFGPVEADRKGQAIVPVDVSPRARVARIIAVDRKDLETVKELPLPAADFPRALVLAPASLWPGGRGTVSVYAIETSGDWRAGDAPPPELDLPPGVRLVAAPAPVEPGRWDALVEADAAIDTTSGVTVGARVDGSPAVPAGMELRVSPPATPAGPGRVDLTLRAGLVDSFDGFASRTAAVDAAVNLLRGRVPVALVLGVGVASGETDTVEKSGQKTAAVSQLVLQLGGRAQVTLGRLGAELALGLGWSFASAEVGRTGANPMDKPPRDADASALVLFVGGGASLELGPGALVVDLRWTEVDLDDSVPLSGSALGVGVSVGYRLGL